MIILAIESTTEACSVALNQNGSITELFEIAPRQHTRLLLNMVDKILKQQGIARQEINAIAFCRGPGAFTGLRITTGVAQGLAFGLNVPLIPVSSLAALAQGAYRDSSSKQTHFLSCLDARKSEVFWGIFTVENGYAKPLIDESVSASEDIVTSLQRLNSSVERSNIKNWQVVGTAVEIIKKINEPSLTFVDSATENIHYPHAHDVALLAAKEYEWGNTVNAEQAVPVYLRNNVTD